jgi:hypothetical protein
MDCPNVAELVSVFRHANAIRAVRFARHVCQPVSTGAAENVHDQHFGSMLEGSAF